MGNNRVVWDRRRQMSFEGPTWTEKPKKMRIIDPLGTERTINRLLSRLLFPVLSNAITYRLRYLSYWTWVTKNVDAHTKADRALYEKVYLFANVAHDCSGDGTEGKGIVNASRKIKHETTISELYQSEFAGIDISPAHFTLTNGQSGFDQYYKGVLYNLLLFENEQTLTPLGQALAQAFDAALGVEFTAVQEAVDQEYVTTDLVEQLGTDGCLCQLSSREQELLAKAHLGATTRETSWNELNFIDNLEALELSLVGYLAQEQQEMAAELLDEDDVDDEAGADIELSDLEIYIGSGQDAFTRASFLLLLLVSDWVESTPAETPPFDELSDARRLWQFVICSEYFSDALETLLIATYQALRATGPATGNVIIQELVEHPAFESALTTALTGIKTATEPDSPDRLRQTKHAIYYGTACEGTPRLDIEEDPAATGHEIDPDTESWAEIRDRITSPGPDFVLDETSEWGIRVLIGDALQSSPSLATSARLFAYSGLLLAQIQARYHQLFGADDLLPHRQWFLETQQKPSPQLVWALPYDEAQSFRTVVGDIAHEQVLQRYQKRLYNKIGDQLGKSPQLLSVDADGTLSYERSFNRDHPNRPTLKYDRTADILYELGWIDTDDLTSSNRWPTW